MFSLIIYRKPDNTFYYKFIRGYLPFYPVGSFNSYGHEIILTIDSDILSSRFTRIIPIPIYRVIAKWLSDKLSKIARY